MSEMSIAIIVFCAIFGMLAILFLSIGIIMTKNRKRREQKCTEKTWGKVIDIVKRESYDFDRVRTVTWHPVVEYTIGNLKFVKESMYGNSTSKYAIGQNIEICYNPEDYNEYYIVGENTSKIIGTIFIAAGIIPIIVIAIFAIIAMVINGV